MFELILGAVLGVAGTLIVVGLAIGIKRFWQLRRRRRLGRLTRRRHI
jgi:hypothetical protein